jgi:hypothetical protein
MKSTARKAPTYRRNHKAQFVAVLAGLCVSSTSLVMAQTSAAPAQASESAAWKKITLSGLDFESPVSMQALEVPLEGPNAENVRKMIARWDSMQGEKDGVYVAASVVTYVPDAEVSLDGAVKGAMEGLANNIRIPVPEYTAKETIISGQPARRIDSTFTTAVGGQDRKISIRALFVLSGKRLSQLMTIDMRSNSESAALAEKILQSASVVPAK